MHRSRNARAVVWGYRGYPVCFGVPLTLSKRDSAPKNKISIKDLSLLYCDAHLIVTDYKKEKKKNEGQGLM